MIIKPSYPRDDPATMRQSKQTTPINQLFKNKTPILFYEQELEHTDDSVEEEQVSFTGLRKNKVQKIIQKKKFEKSTSAVQPSRLMQNQLNNSVFNTIQSRDSIEKVQKKSSSKLNLNKS